MTHESEQIEPSKQLVAAFDNRKTHDGASLKALGGVFYKVGEEEWCDTAICSWRREGQDVWVRIPDHLS